MRVLFVSNLYPPHVLGGMEIRCKETVDRLTQRGHTCHVLTSDHGVRDQSLSEDAVTRALHLEAGIDYYRPLDYLLNRRTQLRHNSEALVGLADVFRPDLVFFWCMWNLSPALIVTAKALFPNRVVQSFAGYWPVDPDAHQAYWLAEGEDDWKRWLRKLVAPLALSHWYRPVRWPDVTFEHAIFVSKYVQDYLCQAGLDFPHAKVIFSGIETEEFTPATVQRSARQELRAICAGGWARHKGAYTAIEALQLLSARGVRGISLTVIGRGHPEERVRLETMVREAHLEDQVHFRAAVPRSEMPRILRKHDVLLVPTLSPDPLPRTVMEGMASGLVVIASHTGGTPEMIADGRDGFLFPPGDSRRLSDLLVRLDQAPELRQQVATRARATAVGRFDIRRMVDEIEAFLQEVQVEAQQERV